MVSQIVISKLDRSIEALEKKRQKNTAGIAFIIEDLKFVRSQLAGTEYPENKKPSKNNRIPMSARPVSIFEELPEKVKFILQAVSIKFSINPNILLSSNREGGVVKARHLSMFFCCQYLNNSPSIVGGWHNKDHSVIYLAIENVRSYCQTNKKYSRDFITLKEEISKEFGF